MELPLWFLYFATVLAHPCFQLAYDAPPLATETRAARRQPLMIEAPTTWEAAETLSFRWFQPHSHLASPSGVRKSPRVELPELEDKSKVKILLPILKIKPAVQSQAPDVVHPPTLDTANSLHLADYIDESRSETANQPQDPSSAFNPETSSIRAASSHPDISDVSEPALVQSFERISGRRTTPRIQLECSQVGGGASEMRPPPLPVIFSVEPLPLGEYDFGLLSEFPAPPKKG